MKRWTCRRCRAVVVQDGDADIFEGSQIVHNRMTCSPVRIRIPDARVPLR